MKDLTEKEIDNLKEFLHKESEGRSLFITGMDDAILGACMRGDMDYPRAVYSIEKIVSILMDRDGLTSDEAYEYFNEKFFYVIEGEGSPFFIETGSSRVFEEDMVIETFSSSTTSMQEE